MGVFILFCLCNGNSEYKCEILQDIIKNGDVKRERESQELNVWLQGYACHPVLRTCCFNNNYTGARGLDYPTIFSVPLILTTTSQLLL